MANLDHNEMIWNWETSASGRVTSVSPQFGILMGVKASQNIIGNTFWGFCDETDEPNNSWKDLAIAIREQKRINKFIFSYMSGGGKHFKIKLQGEALFQRGKYIGHKGTGQLCDEDEITTYELAQTSISYSLDALDIGIGFFDEYGILQDYNDKFNRHYSASGVRIVPNMTIGTILSHVKAKNIVLNCFENNLDDLNQQEVLLRVRGNNKASYHIRTSLLSSKGYAMKIEVNDNLSHMLSKTQKSLQQVKDENLVLSNRVEDYRHKLDSAIKNKFENSKSEDDNFQEISKLISFYENQVDIGILITDINGKPLNINYVATEIFNYRTSRDFLKKVDNISNIKGYDPNRNEIIKKMLQKVQSRFERDIIIENEHGSHNTKEVIIFYPSAASPEKVVSFLYNIEDVVNDDVCDIITQFNGLDNNIIDDFLKQIKTSVEVISSYSDESNKMEKQIEEISNSCVSLLSYINDFSHVYNALNDEFELNNNIFNPEKIIHKICEGLNHQVNLKSIDMVVEFQDHNMEIICDESVFESAINKLITNAVNLSEFSNVTIRIKGDHITKKMTLTISDESKKSVEEMLAIKEGEILPNDHNVIFNIHTAQTLLEKMGFSLHVISFKGLGNTLTIYFPEDSLVIKGDKNTLIA